MSLREEVLDAIIAGTIGTNGTVTRQEIITHFPHHPENYTGSFLSNSEMETSQHSPTYEKFTRRVGRGVYQIPEEVLHQRLNERS